MAAMLDGGRFIFLWLFFVEAAATDLELLSTE
jgi:hypothetical protein